MSKRNINSGDVSLDRRLIITRLAATFAVEGRLPRGAYADAAERLRITERQVRRLVSRCAKDGVIAQPMTRHKRRSICPLGPAAELDLLVSELIHFGGNVRAVWESLRLQAVMSLRTLQRRVAALPKVFTEAARDGYRGAVKYGLYSTMHIPARGYLYSMDHSQLPIRVIPARGLSPVWVWFTSVMDMKSRVVLSYRLSLEQPNTEITTDTLIEAIVGWEDGERGFVGGKPEFLHSDRGGDFVGQAMTLGLLDVDIARRFTEPYSSWQNPITERFHGTLDTSFAPTVTGYSAGGQDEYTKRVLRLQVPDESLLTVNQLDYLLGEWIQEYNNRPHSSLQGRTPLDAWHADAKPMPRIEEEVLRAALQRRVTRTVSKNGITLDRRVYACADLMEYRDRAVEVRYLEHQRDSIQVYYQGRWICQVWAQDARTEEQRYGIVSHRRAVMEDIRRKQAQSAQRKVSDARDRLEEKRRTAVGDALPEVPFTSDGHAAGPTAPAPEVTPAPTQKRAKSNRSEKKAKPVKDALFDHLNSQFSGPQDKAS